MAPTDLQSKIDRLARHIRVRRLVRALSLTVLVPVVLFSVLFATNLAVELPPFVLLIALAAVVVATVVTALRSAVALCRPLDPNALAALIEKQYPDLNERLTSAVELSAATGPGYGAAALIDLLQRDAAERVRGLDVLPAYPRRPSRLLGLCAAAALAAAVCLGLVWETYGDFAARFFTAWQARHAFDIEVDYCSGFAAKGRPLLLSARLLPGRDFRKMPADCTLLFRAGDAAVCRLPMQRLGGQRFAYTIAEIDRDFEFQIEAGGVLTDSHQVRAIDPVEIVDALVHIAPPPYAKRVVRTVPAVQDMSAFQFGEVRLDLRLTRLAVVGTLDLRPEKTAGAAHVLKLPCSTERAEAGLTLPVLTPGSYRLSVALDAEHGITTVRPLGTLSVHADAPPRFTETLRLARTDNSHAAPDDVVPLRIAIEDDLGIERVELEYRVNDGHIRSEMVLQTPAERQAEHEYRFHLAGKVKVDDVLHFRVKATDNRRLAKGAQRDVNGLPAPAADLAPQVTYQPSESDKDSWFTLKIGKPAVPLHTQDILAERDELKKRIDVLHKKLAREREQIQQLRAGMRDHPRPLPDQATSLTAIRAMNRDVTKGLDDLARHAEKQAGFDELADTARDVALSQMLPADQALGKAQDPHLRAEPRDLQFGKADEQLVTAQKRLDELRQRLDRLAQDRVDQIHMERLARREDELAKRAAQLTGNTDPKDKVELAALKAAQQKLLDELRKLARQSPLFQQQPQAQSNPAEDAARKAMQLAERQRDLTQDMQSPAAERLKRRLADLAAKQQDLAERITQLAREVEQAKHEALPAAPLRAEAAQQAAKALQQAQLPEAQERQRASSAELERLAQELGGKIALPGDARRAAEQLAKLQEKLGKRLMKLAEDLPRLDADALTRALGQIEREQRALAKATADLSIPRANAPAEKELREARAATEQAADTLKKRDALTAFGHMEKAQAALERLSRALPETKEKPKAAPPDKDRRAQEAKALELAKEQRALHDAVAELAKQSATAPDPAAKQRDLRREAEELVRELRQLAQNMESPKGRESAMKALAAAEKAEAAMKQAEARDPAAAKPAAAAKQAAAAAKMLDDAALQAAAAARQFTLDKKMSDGDKLGQAMRQSEQEAAQAQQSLDNAQPQEAAPAMHQAAQAMQQSASFAQQLMIKGTTPGPGGKTPGGAGMVPAAIPAGVLPKGFEAYAGRSWGELPGELRGAMLQDMRTRYGDDFARIIQGYFEDLSAPPRERRRPRE